MTTPWYKQFWPWFLIAIPVVTFIMSGLMLHFAMDTKDSLVVDDYYKEGKAINARLDKLEQAKKRNITTELTVDGTHVAVKFHSGIPQQGNALKLGFYHVTLKDLDTEVLLSRDAKGIYRGDIEQPLNGKWRISLTPLDDEWKVQNTLILPHTGAMAFNP